ncbi:hypothetical protein Ctob_016025 [Chrysochromulina tobinii]|uniref:Uncharacterized protein n=1 Tax=Chrysochromulina tobinii TaxID=1460289 RepID=A0A0M0JEW0_9EUKA|nr:hypothetical protein Ctob_003832 [Chrysochromulina tobinii]KOO36005.1 hypothetical protein Ctob_016025 [Chrysochromulina tobinii]|eukprot:KOO25131.1 hypothetical protein Ctob_003832 [Chrysochromulina sp. CCMP291]
MAHDEMATVPPWTLTPPPCKQRAKLESPMRAMGTMRVSGAPCTYPLVMLSPISCTTPNEPGLMYSTRRRLEELACASSTTEPATSASMTTLLVTVSSALRK